MLRGDFFNLFNHPNFDIPAHVFNCPATGACGAASTSTSPRLAYGGGSFARVLSADNYGDKPPRQIQLSMRYVF
jgi:hypothetical protein